VLEGAPFNSLDEDLGDDNEHFDGLLSVAPIGNKFVTNDEANLGFHIAQAFNYKWQVCDAIVDEA
jgi:hypothetical protein